MSVNKKFEKLGVNPHYAEEADSTEEKRQAFSEDDAKRRQNVYKFRPAAEKTEDTKVYAVGFIKVYLPFLACFLLTLIHELLLNEGFYNAWDGIRADLWRCAAHVIIYLLPAAVFCLAVRRQESISLGLHRFSPAYVTFLVLGFLLMITLIAAEKFALAYFFSETGSAQNFRLTDADNPVSKLFAYVIFPAICEELFLRGLLQGEISRKAGGLAGILVSALAFALLHFDLPYFPVYFTAGLMLAIVRHVCGSVVPCVLLHAANNLFSMFFSAQLTFIASERAGNVFVFVILILLVFLLLLFFLKSLEVLCAKKAVSAELQNAALQTDCDAELSSEADSDDNRRSSPHRTADSPLPESENIIRFRSAPFRLTSDSGYTLHKLLRVLFSPALILAFIAFFLVTLL